MDAHTIHAAQHHLGWDRDQPPVATVASGTELTFECVDASGGQLDAGSTDADLAAVEAARVNPVTGPVAVEGARPGDALRVELLAFELSGWGWTGIIPGFGLLADDFPDAALHTWSIDAAGREPAHFGDVASIPVRPFTGTIGVAPAAEGRHSVIPPRRVGGNLDVRDLTAGTVLELPVEVPGALLSIGDTHAAQGDGEVCGTAIESPMTVVVRVEVVPGGAPVAPRYETAGPPRGSELDGGALVTTGVGPDLMGCTRDAVRAMIDLLGATRGLAPHEAYMLCSVAADVRVLEVVDAPNWVVGCALPKGVLR